MAAELLVDSRIDDGERVVDQLIRDNFEVTVAFWVKPGEYASVASLYRLSYGQW